MTASIPIPEEIQDLIAEKSFTIAYKLRKFQLAGKLRSKNPISLEFLFRINDVQKKVTVMFDGQWKFDDDLFWLKFKDELLFKQNLILLLEKKVIMLETRIGRHFEDSMSVYLKYPSCQTFLMVTDVLLDYIPITHHGCGDFLSFHRISDYITQFIECVDFPAKLNYDKKMSFRRKLNGNFTLVITHNNQHQVKVYKVYHFGNVCYMVLDYKDINTISNAQGLYDLYYGNEIASCIQFDMNQCSTLLNEMELERKNK